MKNFRLVASVLLICLLVGCASGVETGSEAVDRPPISAVHQQWIDEILSRPWTPESHRRILEDSWVTDAELRELQQQFVECVQESLPYVNVSFDVGGGFTTTVTDPTNIAAQDVQDQLIDNCQFSTLGLIPGLYYNMRNNPDGLTWDEAVRACLERTGLDYGAGLSVDEFSALLWSSGFQQRPGVEPCIIDPYSA